MSTHVHKGGVGSGIKGHRTYRTRQTITHEEKEAVSNYTAAMSTTDECAANINDFLRTGSAKYQPTGELHTRLKKAVSKIDSAMQKSRLEKDISVFRGIHNPYQGALPFEAKVGEIVSDKAYVSTSTDRKVANKFTNQGVEFAKEGYLMEIKVPQGSPALLIGGHEKEVILPRGANFKITKVTKGRNGTTRLTAEMVPPTGEPKKQPPEKPKTIETPVDVTPKKEQKRTPMTPEEKKAKRRERARKRREAKKKKAALKD